VKLNESRWETAEALQQAITALEERNEYIDMVKELQGLLREAVGKLESWKRFFEECAEM